MRIFIFEELDKVSDNYHSGGGLVIIAKDEAHAKELISTDPDIVIEPEDWKDVESYALKFETAESRVIVFPDAGCC